MINISTLSPKYLKLNKKLPTSQGKKKRNLPSILSKWIVHFLLLTKNYPRILNPIFEKHFHVSSIIFHIIFISYLWPQKRIHKPCPLSRKKNKEKKDRDHFYHPPCTKISLPSLSWLCTFKIQPRKQPVHSGELSWS